MSTWREENEEIWEQNAALLDTYRIAEPWERWLEEQEKKTYTMEEILAVLRAPRKQVPRKPDGTIPF